jgi:hypothetical protein
MSYIYGVHILDVSRSHTTIWIFVCCECRALSGRGLCDELIARPEESYQLCCVVVHKQPLDLHMWMVVGRNVVGRCQVAYAT